MATILLLLKDVEDLGRSGDVVKVKPGYARNYLMPQGFAVTADKNALRMQEKLQEERIKQAAQDRKDSEALSKKLEGIEITTLVKVDPEGHMYGSVSVVDIIHLLKEQQGIVVEKRTVQLKHPIKSTGTHTIELKLPEDVQASFSLKVESEQMESTAE